MTSVFQVSGYQTELARIVNDALGVMFSAAMDPAADCQQGNDSYTALVSFVGEWNGALLLRCGSNTARDLAQRLFKLPSVTPEDVVDALGELANMIGGNLKSVLPPGVILSVPSVVRGNDLAVLICGGNESQSSTFSYEAGPFEITLVRAIEKLAC